MITLKNPFAKSTTPTDPLETVFVAATDKAWGAYMVASRAWKTETEKLAGARSDLEQATHTVGEHMADGKDTSAALVAMQAAQSLVTQRESAVAVLLQRKQEAEANWTHAKRQAALEAEAAASAALLALAPQWEAFLKEASRLAHATTAAANTLRLRRGNERFGFALAEIRGQADLFLGLSMSSLTGTGFLPERLRKFRSMSECLESITGMKARE